MSSRFTFLAAMSLCVVVTVAGCGSPGDGYTGARGQVTGKVTLDGQPLQKGCQIIFMSATGGYTAAGVIEDAGAYKLSYSDERGLPAVEYQIQFTAPISPPASAPSDPTKMAETMKLGTKMKGTDEGPFPTKYASVNTSKLFFTVKEGQNTADFALAKE
jgi:hypothetical protein